MRVASTMQKEALVLIKMSIGMPYEGKFKKEKLLKF